MKQKSYILWHLDTEYTLPSFNGACLKIEPIVEVVVGQECRYTLETPSKGRPNQTFDASSPTVPERQSGEKQTGKAVADTDRLHSLTKKTGDCLFRGASSLTSAFGVETGTILRSGDLGNLVPCAMMRFANRGTCLRRQPDLGS